MSGIAGECLIFKFLSALAQGCLGDNLFGNRRVRKNFEELVELCLIGAFEEITKEENEKHKRQFPLPGKIGVFLSALFEKFLRRNKIFKEIKQIGTCFGKQVPCLFDNFFQEI